MRRLLLLSALGAFIVWRSQRLNEHDRRHGFGAYSDVVPVVDD